MVREVANPSDILGRDFKPCADLKTMVVKVPSSGIYYLGDVTYAATGNQLMIKYSENISAAQTYIASHYPALGSTFSALKYDLLPTTNSCSNTFFVPVYL
jgi:hypothetical protein